MPARAANLVKYLKGMGAPYGCRALHCHVSALPKGVRTRDNMAKAVQILNGLNRLSPLSKLFLLNSLDIVYVSFSLDAGLLRQAGSNVHKVFGREQLAANAYGGADFATIVDIANSDDRLLVFAESLAVGDAEHLPGTVPRVLGACLP